MEKHTTRQSTAQEHNSSQHPAHARRAKITRQSSQPVRNTDTPSLAHGTGHPSRNLTETKSHSRAHKSEHGTGQLDTPQSATSSPQSATSSQRDSTSRRQQEHGPRHTALQCTQQSRQLDTPQSAQSATSSRRAQIAHSGAVRHAANKSTPGRSTQQFTQLMSRAEHEKAHSTDGTPETSKSA